MPWISRVKGVVEGYLGGQATGGAIADILFGVSNPCGKLAETFPKKLSDTPAFIEYLSDDRTARYSEGLFIGYRYYDAKQLESLFPFGFGLSYTTFEYTGMTVDQKVISEQEELTVRVTVKNTGDRTGKEIVQLYIHDVECSVLRPYKELKDFQKVELAPGEEKEVVFHLNKRAFAYYDTDRMDWCVETGDFEVLVGKSSTDIVLRNTVTVTAQGKKNIYTRNSSFAECLLEPHAAEVIQPYLEGIKVKFNLDEESERGKSFLMGAPLRNLISYSPTPVSEEELVKILNEMNEG
jgi:beta-glucosidase